MHKHIQAFGMRRLASHLNRFYMQLHGMLVGCRGSTKDRVAAGVVQVDAAAMARSSEVLASALREDSNLELDWLWYATRMTSDAQRRICLQRALAIDPSGEATNRGRHTGA